MSGIGQYVYTVIAATIFVAILQSLVPGKGTAATLIKVTAGVYLISVVISPIVKVRLNGLLDYAANIESDASGIIADAQNQMNGEIERIILEEAESYILDEASKRGAEIAVQITMEKDGSYALQGITIRGSVSPLIRSQLSTLIETDLGISEDMQIWEA